MTIDSLLTQTCTITSVTQPDGGTVDEYGNPVEVATSTGGIPCYLEQPGIRDRESDVDRQVSTSIWLLIVPADTTIDNAARVTIEDVEYEVTGDPWPVTNPRVGTASHIEAQLTRTHT